MFNTQETYRPSVVEFDVAPDNSLMPMDFGEFSDENEVKDFFAKNLIAINHAVTAARHMDNAEKKMMRDLVNDLNENQLPIMERQLSVLTQELTDAKSRHKDKLEAIQATINEIRETGRAIKRGLKDIQLDEYMTYRVPYGGRYYFYTYMDGVVKLALIRDIPEREKTEIWNKMAENERFIDDNFNNEPIKEE